MNNDNKQDIKRLDVEKDFNIKDYAFENIDNYERTVNQLEENIKKFTNVLKGGNNEFYRNADLVKEITLNALSLSGYNNRINVIILTNIIIDYIRSFIPDNLIGIDNDELTFKDFLIIIEMLYNDFVEMGELRILIKDELERQNLSVSESEIDGFLDILDGSK